MSNHNPYTDQPYIRDAALGLIAISQQYRKPVIFDMHLYSQLVVGSALSGSDLTVLHSVSAPSKVTLKKAATAHRNLQLAQTQREDFIRALVRALARYELEEEGPRYDLDLVGSFQDQVFYMLWPLSSPDRDLVDTKSCFHLDL